MKGAVNFYLPAEDFEAALIVRALGKVDGNISRCAKDLKTDRTSLARKIHAHTIAGRIRFIDGKYRLFRLGSHRTLTYI